MDLVPERIHSHRGHHLQGGALFRVPFQHTGVDCGLRDPQGEYVCAQDETVVKLLKINQVCLDSC